jgi:uncharacterized RDD family membrane protein YckC
MGRWGDEKSDGPNGKKSYSMGTPAKGAPTEAELKSMTPLERYLAKQRTSQNGTERPAPPEESAPPEGSAPSEESDRRPGTGKVYGTTESSKVESHGGPKNEDAVIEAGLPFEPSRHGDAYVSQTRVRQSEEALSVRDRRVPAGFFTRLGAFLVDFAILWVVLGVIEWPLSLILGWGIVNSYWGSLLITQLTLFAYFGWFYHERGATPGKMLFGLEVAERQSGQRLSYLRSYLREVPGKFISAVPLLAGFLPAAFRKDGMALHDMIFDTQVVRRSKSRQDRRDPTGLG